MNHSKEGFNKGRQSTITKEKIITKMKFWKSYWKKMENLEKENKQLKNENQKLKSNIKNP
jgi:cell division protein FtsB